MINKKGLKYGFNFKSEFSEYKKMCKEKNTTLSYSDWYRRIKDKYKHYDNNRLLDFDKFLSMQIYKKNIFSEKNDIFSSVGTYAISIFLSGMALLVSIIAILNEIQGEVDEAIIRDTMTRLPESDELFLIVEQLHNRLILLDEIMDAVEKGVYAALLFIIPMLIFRFRKIQIKKEIHFLMDYKECIQKIREEMYLYDKI